MIKTQLKIDKGREKVYWPVGVRKFENHDGAKAKVGCRAGSQIMTVIGQPTVGGGLGGGVEAGHVVQTGFSCDNHTAMGR